MMCTTTGIGEAKNRAFSGVISAPPASWVSRNAPAATGMKQSTSSAVGTSHVDLVGVVLLEASRSALAEVVTTEVPSLIRSPVSGRFAATAGDCHVTRS